jgi:hypothetical protein
LPQRAEFHNLPPRLHNKATSKSNGNKLPKKNCKLMLSSQLSASAIAARALRPELVAKCVAARYGGFAVKRAFALRVQEQRYFSSTRKDAWGSKEFFHNDSRLRSAAESNDFLHLDHHKDQEQTLHYEIPMNVRQKVVNPEDAVSLVRDGDTVCVSGFVSQGAAEAVLKALGEKYEKTGSPNKLTLLFGGGPGPLSKSVSFLLVLLLHPYLISISSCFSNR